jgi:hypothetical protein
MIIATHLDLVVGVLAIATVACNVKRTTDPSRDLRRALVIAAAGWASEDSIIRLYGAYQYTPRWAFFADQVPVAIVLCWPALIMSAISISEQWTQNRPYQVIFTAVIVLLDAALIEPVSVTVGLWQWKLPGMLGVPPIALFGWGVFGLLMASGVHLMDRIAPAKLHAVFVVLLAPLVLLLVLPCVVGWIPPKWSWPDWIACGGAIAVFGNLLWALGHQRSRRMRLLDLLQRAPAAAFFFWLIAAETSIEESLLFQASTIAAIYLVMCGYAGLAQRWVWKERPTG